MFEALLGVLGLRLGGARGWPVLASRQVRFKVRHGLLLLGELTAELTFHLLERVEDSLLGGHRGVGGLLRGGEFVVVGVLGVGVVLRWDVVGHA